MIKTLHCAKRATLVIVCGIAFIAAIVLEHARLEEPYYKGRQLKVWLEDYDMTGPNITHASANEAVQHLGTNALPILLKMLGSKDSRLKVMVMALATNQSFVNVKFVTAENRHSRALAAFRALGPGSSVALPELSRINNKDNYSYVMSAMAGCGKDAFIYFVECLTNHACEIRSYAAYELGMSDFKPFSITGILSDRLNDDDPNVRWNAAMSLAKTAKEAKVGVPALIARLEKERNNRVRMAIMFALGQYGDQAVSAVNGSHF